MNYLKGQTQNKMKKQILNLALLAIIGLWMSACTEEKDPVLNDQDGQPEENVTIDFDEEELTFGPDEDSVYVKINLNETAITDGHVKLMISGEAEYGTHFLTIPLATDNVLNLEIESGSDYVDFYVVRTGLPVVESLDIQMDLDEPAEGFELGEQTSSKVWIPAFISTAEVNFQYDFLHVSETDENYEVTLDITGAFIQPGYIVMQISTNSTSEYGVHYTTIPEAIQDEIVLEVAAGSSTASFTFSAINDNVLRGNYELTLTVLGNEQIAAGDYSELIIRVEEDDSEQQAIHAISELRTMFEQYDGDFWMAQDYFVKGIVTSDDNVGVDRAFYLQDATGGILLKLTYANLYKIGDEIILNLKNATSKNLNAQKAMVDISNLATIVAQNQYVMPEEITPAQLYSGDYSGKKVKINGLTFSRQGVKFISNHTATSPAGNITVAVYSAADFAEYEIPAAIVNITGIVGDWGYIMPQIYDHDIHIQVN